MKIRVCLISLYAYKLFHPRDERVLSFGGSEVQQYQLARELVKDGNYVMSFIVGNFFAGQPETEQINIDGETIRLYKALPCKKRNIILDGVADFWRLFRAMKRTSADIYLIRGGGSLAGKVGCIAKGVLRKKFIYSSAHDRDSNLEFMKKHSSVVNLLFRFGLAHADRVICQHQDQQKAFEKNFSIKATVIKSMYHIAPGIEPKVNREYVLWVSRMESWKQPELFAELAKNLPKEKFLMITNSDVTDFRKQNDCSSNLTIRQNVPFEEMDEYFQKAKIFVNTSLEEGFPNTFIQAAKNQTPIVSLRVNPENILEEYGMGKCANGSISKLIADVEEILESPQTWRTMSESAYRYAQENHDSKHIASQYKALFQELRSS